MYQQQVATNQSSHHRYKESGSRESEIRSAMNVSLQAQQLHP